MTKQTIGSRVQALRNHLKLNHHEFAAKVGTTVSTIYRVESGEVAPRENTLINMCKTLGVNRDWLIHGKGQMEVNEIEPEESVKDAIIKELRERIAFLEGLIKQQMKK